MDVLVELILKKTASGSAPGGPVLDNSDGAVLSIDHAVQQPASMKEPIQRIGSAACVFGWFDTVGLWLNQQDGQTVWRPVRKAGEYCPRLRLEPLHPPSATEASRKPGDNGNGSDLRPQTRETRNRGWLRRTRFRSHRLWPRYDLPATSMLSESAAPAYASKIAGKWLLLHDESIQKAPANIDRNRGLDPLGCTGTFTDRAPFAIDPLFQEIQREAEVPSARTGAGRRRRHRLRLGRFVHQLGVQRRCLYSIQRCHPQLDARFADGRPLAAATGHSVAQSTGASRSDKNAVPNRSSLSSPTQ